MASVSPNYNNKEISNPSFHLPSPRSLSSNSSTTTTTTSNINNGIHPPKPLTRSEPGNPYPTTFVQADTSSFKQVVQMLTGSSKPAAAAAAAAANSSDPSPSKTHAIPPIKSTPKKQQSSSGFKLYERRNSLSKNLKISPLIPSFSPNISGSSPRKPEILSPSILDFPSLVLSPVTPLIPDPFDGTGPVLDSEAEEKAIKEKGFYLHPSPVSTPRDIEPRLLPLFPTTSPRASASFKQVVQMLTGSSKPAAAAAAAAANSSDPSPSKTHAIPPIKSTPKKQQSSSGFKLYERRNSLSKNLKISPLIPSFSPNISGSSPRKPEILSPSILDFPSLVLSPVTPLIPDPFDGTGPVLDSEAEEKAIKEKGFYLHPSPVSTPRDIEPRLLPLFPTTSPRASGSSSTTSS